MQNTFHNITHQQAFIWYITPNKKYKLNTHAIANISHNIHSISPLIFMLLFTVLEGHTIQYNISNKPHEERKKSNINPIAAMVHTPRYQKRTIFQCWFLLSPFHHSQRQTVVPLRTPPCSLSAFHASRLRLMLLTILTAR